MDQTHDHQCSLNINWDNLLPGPSVWYHSSRVSFKMFLWVDREHLGFVLIQVWLVYQTCVPRDIEWGSCIRINRIPWDWAYPSTYPFPKKRGISMVLVNLDSDNDSGDIDAYYNTKILYQDAGTLGCSKIGAPPRASTSKISDWLRRGGGNFAAT